MIPKIKNILNNPNIKLEYIKVLNPDNLIEINQGQFNLSLLAKDVNLYKKELIETFLNDFDFAKDFEGYEEFIGFFRKALEEDWKITENEEFPGKLLKFYKYDKLIKCVYIKDEKIMFLDSFSEKYKELQIENIKEILNNINEELKLEGKKPLSLEFNND